MTSLSHMMQLYVLVRFLSSIPSRGQQSERDVLLRALVEAEIDGAAVANQLTALKETIDSLAKVNMVPTECRMHDVKLQVLYEIFAMLVSHLFLDSFRRSGSQNCTQLLWGGSRSCWWRRLRCLVIRITEFGSS